MTVRVSILLLLFPTACVSSEQVEHFRTPRLDAASAQDAVGQADAPTLTDAGLDAETADGFVADAIVNADAAVDGGVNDAAPIAAQVCNADGWCWERPLPQGNDLHAAFAISATDVWMAGDAGTILHLENGAWRGYASGTTRSLLAIWGSAADDVWIGGESGTLLHWNGAVWSAVPNPTTTPVRAIWGSGSNDVFAVGESSTILHWNGIEWLPMQHPQTSHFNAVWGTSSSNVWAAGVFGNILHYDGQSWTVSQSGTMVQISALWGRSANEVYAGLGFSDIGPGGLLRWNGQVWTPVQGAPTDYVQAISGTTNELYLLGAETFDARSVWRFDGAWSEHVLAAFDPGLRSISALGAAVWIAGRAGTILERSGNTWRPHHGASDYDLDDVFGFSSDDVWAVGPRGTVLHRDATRWSLIPAATADLHNFHGVWGAASDDVWIVGTNGVIEHWDGTRFTTFSSGTPAHLNDVWGSGPDDVWAVGMNARAAEVVHWDGNRWSVVPIDEGGTLTGVWVGAPGDVWISRFGGSTWQRSGNGWVQHAGAGGEDRAIHGSGSEVWVTGFGGVARWNGQDWVTISGSGGEAIFVNGGVAWWAGRFGTIQAWNGALIRYDSGTMRDVLGVWSSPSGVTYAVGAGGMILRHR